jgi:hypothetical protein
LPSGRHHSPCLDDVIVLRVAEILLRVRWVIFLIGAAGAARNAGRRAYDPCEPDWQASDGAGAVS